jgi:hypothetical protein
MDFSDLFFNGKIQWTGSTTHGPGGVTQVHCGLRWCGQKGAATPCWRAGVRAHWCSSTAMEEDELDEAVPEGCSQEHEMW